MFFPQLLLVSLSYTFRIFFDFSGYCDMAMGIGHMSLTRFLRTYVYIPLGGNRKGRIRTYVNVMIVFLVSGIWHGANWTFVFWGGWHGVLNCLNRMFDTVWKKLNKVTQWLLTFMTVNVLWIFFRAESISSAVLFLKRMCRLSDFTIRGDLYDCFKLSELEALVQAVPILNTLGSRITGFYLWGVLFCAFFVVLDFWNSKEIEFRPIIARSLATVIFMLWSVVSFTGISTSLYFDFWCLFEFMRRCSHLLCNQPLISDNSVYSIRKEKLS